MLRIPDDVLIGREPEVGDYVHITYADPIGDYPEFFGRVTKLTPDYVVVHGERHDFDNMLYLEVR